MRRRFIGKNAIVTGASQGIGYAMAKALAEEGGTVYILDIDDVAGREAEQLFRKAELDVTFFKCDITDERALSVVRQKIPVETLHVLLNNAGIELNNPIQDTTVEAWDRVSSVNLRGPFLVTKTFLPLLEAANGAAIVNTSSISGLIGWPDSAAYCATKGGVVALTKQLACDLAQKQIRVNCICPGTTRTPMIGRLIGTGPLAEKESEEIAQRHLLRRFAEPEEIAQAALFLASEDASFVTGAVLPVDGGYTAK
ncbi:MAG: SDR family NAD(P)-dependent oxidoreductase [Sphaerochaetaceae bacterium]|nr:SDR family NAD(P)-dependent oxidoreductase [Sphaerochaetaceae bacterium]